MPAFHVRALPRNGHFRPANSDRDRQHDRRERASVKNYVISTGKVYFFDDYFFSKKLLMPDADPASFEALGDWFARDRRHVYFLHNIVAEADPGSFVCLGGYNDHWAKDRIQAYHFVPTKAARQYRALQSNSLDRFAILAGCPFCEYAGDDERVYYRGKLIRGAHAPSFRAMIADRMGEVAGASSYHFTRDHARIYFDGQALTAADYNSFTVIHEPGLGHLEYGVDANGAYHKSRRTGKLAALAHADLPEPVRAHFFKGSAP
jgi:DKNYY family